ncbi:mRNA splicing protein [Savitreella phatthalungensis]
MSALASLLPAPKYKTKQRKSRWDDSPERDALSNESAFGATADASTAESSKNSGTTVTRAIGTQAPEYGRRRNWRPSSDDVFGDGGAYPEVPIAQYPRGMGRESQTQQQSGKSLALQLTNSGKVDYSVIARQGQSEDKIIHSSYKDLIPLRSRADAGEISLEKPSEEEVQETAERTGAALQRLVQGQLAAERPKTLAGRAQNRNAPTYVKYTPAAGQMGDPDSPREARMIKMVEMPVDPMEPPKHRHRKVPRGPGSPPPPIMHSPPRKITVEEKADWIIPPAISNWKNPHGYTVPLDKRLAASGRGAELEDTRVNDRFAQLSEALFVAEKQAREEVHTRNLMKQQLADKERDEKEERLRELAQRARHNRAQLYDSPPPPVRGRPRSTTPPAAYRGMASAIRSPSPKRSFRSPTPERRRQRSPQRSRRDSRRRDSYIDEDDDRSRRRRRSPSTSRSRSRSPPPRRRARRSSYDDQSEDSEDDREAARARDRIRRERVAEAERAMRMSRMKRDRYDRDRDRDISERVALGKSATDPADGSKETQFDQRLFNRAAGVPGLGQGDDTFSLYDKPLFANRDAAQAIYAPFKGARGGAGLGAGGADEETVESVTRGGRFEALGQASHGFKGPNDSAALPQRDGPVQFERDETIDRPDNAAAYEADRARERDIASVNDLVDQVSRETAAAAAAATKSQQEKTRKQQQQSTSRWHRGDDYHAS